MSVASTSVKVQYNADGVTTIFGFPFELLTDKNAGVVATPTDVLVYFNDTLQSSALYTVNGPYANPNPNSVVFNNAPAQQIGSPLVQNVITIVRAKPQTQASRFLDNTPLPASAYELALDKLTMEVQQLQEQLSRAILFKPTTKQANLVLPEPVADTFLGWDDAGQNLILRANPAATVANATFPYPIIFAAAIPTVGTYAAPTVLFYTVPAAGGAIGAVCVTSGTPGVWKEFGPIQV